MGAWSVLEWAETTRTDPRFPLTALWLKQLGASWAGGTSTPLRLGSSLSALWVYCCRDWTGSPPDPGVPWSLSSFSMGELALAPALTLGGLSLAELRL